MRHNYIRTCINKAMHDVTCYYFLIGENLLSMTVTEESKLGLGKAFATTSAEDILVLSLFGEIFTMTSDLNDGFVV